MIEARGEGEPSCFIFFGGGGFEENSSKYTCTLKDRMHMVQCRTKVKHNR